MPLTRSPVFSAVPLALLLAVVLAAPVAAHEEREASFPDGRGSVPEYPATGPELVVCKPETARRFPALPVDVRARNEALLARCAFTHIQDAVDAVTQRGTRILVMPGVYEEEPSLELSAECEELVGGVLTYAQQNTCRHANNLIAILGDNPEDEDDRCDRPVCGLLIEGTGAQPTDVVIDGRFRRLNGIRADRADGIYVRNLALQRFEFNALYMMETDGFVIDRVVTRWNDEYGILTFAVDHGLYKDCEAYGNGDSGVYPGSASDINGTSTQLEVPRYAVEIDGCYSHHNALGYSGTSGNSVWVHDTVFTRNGAGWVTDSFVPDHPGMPQDHALLQRNRIHGNNVNYYPYVHSGHCDRPFAERGYENGVVCPTFPAPVGTGILIGGGNYNRFEDNVIYDNWRQGTMQLWVPAAVREEYEPEKQADTSHFNRYLRNTMGVRPDGALQPNGMDFWWDGAGEGNCWDDNTGPAGAAPTSDPATLPDCDAPSSPGAGNPAKTGRVAPCAVYDRGDEVNRDPPGCDWLRDAPKPATRHPQDAAVGRLSGGERVGTAVAVSRATRERADAVVIARADAFADALAGGPLAADVGGPLLLSHSAALPQATADEVRRLGATRAYVLGGTGALSEAVVSGLRAAGVRDVVRLSGATRFDTAAAVARLMGTNMAYLARGVAAQPDRGWEDALAISAVAAFQRRPILLLGEDGIPGPTAAVLDELRIENATVVGGKAAVSEELFEALGEQVTHLDRLSGATRYETSRAAADRGALIGMEPTDTWFATGLDWADALAAGAGAGAVAGNLLLLDGQDLANAPPARAWLDDHAVVIERVRIVGGSGVVRPEVQAAIAEAT